MKDLLLSLQPHEPSSSLALGDETHNDDDDDDAAAAAPIVPHEVEAQAQEFLAEWRKESNDARWFDDCLNAQGVREASLAGAEIGSWLTSHASSSHRNPPPLLVTSPFRRAWQTQLIGFGTAGFGVPGVACGGGAGSSPPLSSSSSWVAHDGLSETPHAEASCTRSTKRDLAKWQPCLNLDLIEEECRVGSVTNAELVWRSLLKKRRKAATEAAAASHEVEKAVAVGSGGGGSELGGGTAETKNVPAAAEEGEEEGEDEEDNEAEAVVVARSKEVAQWLLARPEDVIWVATHQGPMRRLLEALMGVERVKEAGYSKPGNAVAVVIFLPSDDAVAHGAPTANSTHSGATEAVGEMENTEL